MDNQNDNELTIGESLEMFERQTLFDIEMSGTYREAATRLATFAVMYLAYGFAFLSVNLFWSAAYCFKQAAVTRSFAVACLITSKMKRELQPLKLTLAINTNEVRK